MTTISEMLTIELFRQLGSPNLRWCEYKIDGGGKEVNLGPVTFVFDEAAALLTIRVKVGYDCLRQRTILYAPEILMPYSDPQFCDRLEFIAYWFRRLEFNTAEIVSFLTDLGDVPFAVQLAEMREDLTFRENIEQEREARIAAKMAELDAWENLRQQGAA